MKSFKYLFSSHCEREGVAPAALLLEGATQAPVIEKAVEKLYELVN